MNPRNFKALIIFPLLFCGVSFAEPSSNTIDIIKSSALEIRAIQKKQGNFKALHTIDLCYSRVMRPSNKYGHEVEKCLTQDFIIASITATFYKQLSPATRKSRGFSSIKTLNSMFKRLSGTFIYFQVPPKKASVFFKMLKNNALQALKENEENK